MPKVNDRSTHDRTESIAILMRTLSSTIRDDRSPLPTKLMTTGGPTLVGVSAHDIAAAIN